MHVTKPNPKVKQLLKDIEKSGYARGKVELVAICDANPFVYGEPSSDKRGEFQIAFDNLKRKSAVRYKEIVELQGVTPSALTVREAEDEQDALTDLAVKLYCSTTKDEDEFGESPTPPFKNPSIQMKAYAAKQYRTMTPPRTPPRFPSARGLESMMSPSSGSIVDDNLSLGSIFGEAVGTTESNPHVIHIGGKQSMMLPHSFVSLYAPVVRLKGYVREVFYLTKTVAGDLQEYKAMIPPIDLFPNYYNRSILVTAPALDYMFVNNGVIDSGLAETQKKQKDSKKKRRRNHY